MKLSKVIILSSLSALVLASPVFAAATGPDLSALTDGIDFSTVIAAIMAVGVSVVGLVLTIVGIRKVVGFVKTA